jgi:uncharacterized protein YukE
MTDDNESTKTETPKSDTAEETAESPEAQGSETDKLKKTFDEIRDQVSELLDGAREDAGKQWSQDKEVLKEKLVDIDKVKADWEERIDKGYVKAQETWDEDKDDILEKVAELKKSLKSATDKGYAKAQETWSQDKGEMKETVDDVKKALKGGLETVAEKTAGLLNKLLE